MRIALAQINVAVGALKENQAKLADFIRQARNLQSDLVLFPELAVTGYPPEDLLFKPNFIQKNLSVVKALAPLTRGLMALVGFVDRAKDGALYNAAALLGHGKVLGRYHKMLLPNYGVFDEKRYFQAGEQPMVLELTSGRGTAVRIGISICEDIWAAKGPCADEARAGAQLLLNLSASPYYVGRQQERERMLIQRARAYKGWIGYLNLVGGQDELVFDGGSLVIGPSGKVVFRAPQFEEGLYLVEIPLPVSGRGKGRPASGLIAPGSTSRRARSGPSARREEGKVRSVAVSHRFSSVRKRKLSRSSAPLDPDLEIFQALILGLRDYVRKNGFSHVVLGLSGGIDSGLTVAIAVAALGKGAVTGVSMPSRYSSLGTQSDAQRVAKGLGISFSTIPIEQMFEASLRTLAGPFGDRLPDVTEENLQARIRGMILMALSNKFHWLVLATGNKSEISTGYCTLYGDMVGGFAVIKDLPKGWVVRLSHTANRFFGRTVIPDSVFTRPPSAELKPNQRDQDTLPPYKSLDSIMRAYVEEHLSATEIRTRLKVSSEHVERVVRMIDLNEYKRRQAPPGIKITPLAFGRDRRMPITNRFREV